jgi:hypothetical protein
MREMEMSLHLLMGPHLLLHHILGIPIKTTFIPKPSCLAVGASFVRNIMRKVLVSERRVSEIQYLAKGMKLPLFF